MASVRDLNISKLTVVKLNQLAKERGLKGYSKLNKAGLLRLLELQENPVSDIDVPVVTPQPLSRVQRLKKYLLDKVEDTKKYAKSKCNNYVNWLLEHVPPKPKVIDKAFELAKNSILKLFPRKKDTVEVRAALEKFTEARKKDTFDVVETKSASKESAKEYMITGRDGCDPDSFMDAAKETVINLLENNPQTKVKLLLKCIMERTEIKTGEVIAKEAGFSSEKDLILKALTSMKCI